MNISLFGWLEKIAFWRNLSYPIKGALLRAIKGGLSVAVGILLSAALQGVLFPQGLSPIVIIAVTAVLQSVDKFLREWQIAKDAVANHSDIPITDVTAEALQAYKQQHPDAATNTVVTDVNTDATVVTPDTTGTPEVNTDATTATVEPASGSIAPEAPAADGIDPVVFDDPVDDTT